MMTRFDGYFLLFLLTFSVTLALAIHTGKNVSNIIKSVANTLLIVILALLVQVMLITVGWMK